MNITVCCIGEHCRLMMNTRTRVCIDYVRDSIHVLDSKSWITIDVRLIIHLSII